MTKLNKVSISSQALSR